LFQQDAQPPAIRRSGRGRSGQRPRRGSAKDICASACYVWHGGLREKAGSMRRGSRTSPNAFAHRRRNRGRRGLAALLVAFHAAPSPACEMSLVLALDASSSVDDREYRLQRDGLAAALTDREVMTAIRTQGGIWLLAFEWSGGRHQYDWLGWTFLDDPASIRRAAARLGSAERRVDEFPTALGYAIGHALIRLGEAPERCARRVVDVSGDGVNNDGFPPASAYRASDIGGVIVNGLVIEGDAPPPVPYYRTQVIHGPGAFLEIAEDYADYAEAMRRKLLREIASNAYVSLP
jgi:Ca-activated chloride channel homolog